MAFAAVQSGSRTLKAKAVIVVNPHRWLADARGRELVRTAGTVLIVSAAYYLGARLGLVLKSAITPLHLTARC